MALLLSKDLRNFCFSGDQQAVLGMGWFAWTGQVHVLPPELILGLPALSCHLLLLVGLITEVNFGVVPALKLPSHLGISKLWIEAGCQSLSPALFFQKMKE